MHHVSAFKSTKNWPLVPNCNLLKKVVFNIMTQMLSVELILDILLTLIINYFVEIVYINTHSNETHIYAIISTWKLD